MCGIIGAVAERDVVAILLAGLKKLEYRGYDSAGVAVLDEQQLQLCKTQGKVALLEQKLAEQNLRGHIGIAHTRWATHGEPSATNAHPHKSKTNLAVVHNGIIENFAELKTKLIASGYEFDSETDSEVISHLINYHFADCQDLLKAVQAARKELVGAYALAIIEQDNPEQIIAVRCGSPLVIGLGIGENFLASDKLALLPVTQKFIVLEAGDIAQITRDDIKIYDEQDQSVARDVVTSNLNNQDATKGAYKHYMLKEIFEQPNVIKYALARRFADNDILLQSFGSKAGDVFADVKQIHIVACGTSFHAGLIAKHWFEELLNIPCMVDIASEYRYRRQIIPEQSLLVTISQSGETADTLAALRVNQQQYISSLAICNVPESSLVRESDLVLFTEAGPEIGVASTKAFSSQLVALMLLNLAIAKAKKLSSAVEAEIVLALKQLPEVLQQSLDLNEAIIAIAHKFADKNNALFLGRDILYPIAKEGALKLKEISYIHAEAYPAGELKHGPLALIDNHMPVIATAPSNSLLEKLASNLSEVKARGGELFVFGDKDARGALGDDLHWIEVPKVMDCLTPIVYTIPLQLLAYHVAVQRGTDVDQPRNLAKSVTVE